MQKFLENWKPNQVVSGVCFIGAALVASTGHDGWGWLIFAGLMLYY